MRNGNNINLAMEVETNDYNSSKEFYKKASPTSALAGGRGFKNEEWGNSTALDKHSSSEHFREIVPILSSFTEKQTEINI